MEFKELLSCLDDKQIAVLSRKATGMTDVEAVGGIIGRTTLYRWKKEDENFKEAYDIVAAKPSVEILKALGQYTETALVKDGDSLDISQIDDLLETTMLPMDLNATTVEQIRQLELVRLRILAQRMLARMMVKEDVSNRDRISAAKTLLAEKPVEQHLHLHSDPGMQVVEWLRQEAAMKKAAEMVEGKVKVLDE